MNRIGKYMKQVNIYKYFEAKPSKIEFKFQIPIDPEHDLKITHTKIENNEIIISGYYLKSPTPINDIVGIGNNVGDSTYSDVTHET